MPVQQETDILRLAFFSFDQAAGHLQEVYHKLTVQIRDLDRELQAVNLALEVKLQENEGLRKHREMILESLSVGVIVTDSEGRVTLVNRLAEEMIGLSRDVMLHRELDEVWRQSGMPPVPFSSSEHRGRVLFCGEDALSELGRPPCGKIRMIQDITVLTRLKDQLERQKRLAAMGEMIGRIAHEIRNPLGSIELFASLLGNEVQDGAERRSLAEHISTSVRTLDQLLSNLLVVTGPPRPRIQEVDIEALVNEVVTMAVQPIRERSITVREDIGANARTVRGDRSLLRQVGLNLLLNAIQASPEGGVVEVTSRLEPKWEGGPVRVERNSPTQGNMTLVLRVRDYGCGIAPEDQARVFDPFFSRREGGTGLGLAIVHQVMEAHAGWVDLESQQGRGTTVALSFPQGGKQNEHV